METNIAGARDPWEMTEEEMTSLWNAAQSGMIKFAQKEQVALSVCEISFYRAIQEAVKDEWRKAKVFAIKNQLVNAR